MPPHLQSVATLPSTRNIINAMLLRQTDRLTGGCTDGSQYGLIPLRYSESIIISMISLLWRWHWYCCCCWRWWCKCGVAVHVAYLGVKSSQIPDWNNTYRPYRIWPLKMQDRAIQDRTMADRTMKWTMTDVMLSVSQHIKCTTEQYKIIWFQSCHVLCRRRKWVII